eukprot:g60848.t1
MRDIDGETVFFIRDSSHHPSPLRSVSLSIESKLALLSSFVSDTRVSGHSEVAQLRASSSALPTKRNILDSFLAATKGTNQVTPEQQRREAREPTSAVKVLKSDSNDASFLLTFSGRSDTATG